MLMRARSFFASRNVTEVDCPLITAGASIDAHIDLIPIQYNNQEVRYLHSSPEFGMKRLISQGMGDIYQLAHVFRDGEFSPKHNPEFTMVEWYRLDIAFVEMIAETIAFIQLFLGDLSWTTISYREAFRQYAGFDYCSATEEQLVGYLISKGIEVPQSIIDDGKDALLNLILGVVIEPCLGVDSLLVLAYYPSTQAALARTCWHKDECVAERFEIYHNGVELCNGYHELANAKEQKQRFEESNAQRLKLNKQALPIDYQFLEALENGLPDCCGVAVGFDRLMMLRHRRKDIADILSFGWKTA
jgi:lysyl-tRNA synthetase class 2